MLSPILKNEFILNGRYRKTIVELINSAKRSIDVVMFEWKWYKNDATCDPSLINHALLRAMKRGVIVRCFVNSSVQLTELKSVGFNVRTNSSGVVCHSKMMIFDQEVTVMGSHNMTNKAMQSNIETSVVIRDAEFSKQSSAWFNSIWQS